MEDAELKQAFEEFMKQQESNTSPLAEFYSMLEKHDWFYPFSDDFSVERRGKQAEKELLKFAEGNPAMLALYAAYHDHMWSGEAWGNERKAKPARPV